MTTNNQVMRIIPVEYIDLQIAKIKEKMAINKASYEEYLIQQRAVEELQSRRQQILDIMISSGMITKINTGEPQ